MAQKGLDLLDELPFAPSPSSEELTRLQEKSDWTELFFEWHKAIGILALTFSFVLQGSPAVKRIARKKYVVLVSLLNRCARLMMANLRMASEDRHREAIFIVDRALHETAIKLIWLCNSSEKDRFAMYLADGLRNDLRFEEHIRDQIKERGYKIEIERRMLFSIQHTIASSGMSRSKIARSKRLPTMEMMMQEAGFSPRGYLVVQRMGSHHVHGTWTALLDQNLDKGDAALPVKGEFNPPHPNQLMFGSLIVLDAVSAFSQHVIRRTERAKILETIDTYRSALMRHNDLMAHTDKARVK